MICSDDDNDDDDSDDDDDHDGDEDDDDSDDDDDDNVKDDDDDDDDDVSSYLSQSVDLSVDGVEGSYCFVFCVAEEHWVGAYRDDDDDENDDSDDSDDDNEYGYDDEYDADDDGYDDDGYDDDDDDSDDDLTIMIDDVDGMEGASMMIDHSSVQFSIVRTSTLIGFEYALQGTTRRGSNESQQKGLHL